MSPNASRGGSGEAAGVCAALAAALGVAIFWGFTVDDAWITARVAWRIASGSGYRFNASGPIVDAVTPLGWVYVLVPFAKRSPLGAIQAARYLGAVAWILAAGWWGYRSSKADKNPYFAVVFLAAAPFGAWASAGMETGLVVALATLALCESLLGTVAAGIVAAFRPEMIPFCLILSLRSAEPRKKIAQNCARAALVLAFPTGVAAIRYFAFGRAMPLAALAKPSDVEHGLHYLLGVLLFLGPTWLWIGPGWKDLNRPERIIALSVVVHFATLIVVGGDWMPLWRLALPAMPAALWVAACLQTVRSQLMNAIGFTVAFAASVMVGYRVGLPGRHVFEVRAALIDDVQPLLAKSRQLAGLDVGWLGAAFPGDILDLAGITDPRVAMLAGGHTTKKIPNSWFDSRQPDTLVLLTAPGQAIRQSWQGTRFARVVENRVKDMPYWQNCTLLGDVQLRYTSQAYAIIHCK